jgi:hypothetical protein
MSYICPACKRQIRKNYPFGKKSKAEESGHKQGCNKKEMEQQEARLQAKLRRKKRKV